MIQPMATLDDLRARPHWSYSAINQFLRICPAQFAFQRVHRLKSAFVTESLPFGSAFHRTAEYFWRRRAEGQDASADELADLVVWNRDLRKIGVARDLSDLKVEATYVGGKAVYTSPEFKDA
jgi:hypothetical protein